MTMALPLFVLLVQPNAKLVLGLQQLFAKHVLTHITLNQRVKNYILNISHY
jgi:hypothetical protein